MTNSNYSNYTPLDLPDIKLLSIINATSIFVMLFTASLTAYSGLSFFKVVPGVYATPRQYLIAFATFACAAILALITTASKSLAQTQENANLSSKHTHIPRLGTSTQGSKSPLGDVVPKNSSDAPKNSSDAPKNSSDVPENSSDMPENSSDMPENSSAKSPQPKLNLASVFGTGQPNLNKQ